VEDAEGVWADNEATAKRQDMRRYLGAFMMVGVFGETGWET
jgi:hypothetical protein